MKTVADILKTQREKKKLTLEDIHKFIKIHPRYLSALESGDYSAFSGKVHAKGFLKIYAQFLNLNVEEVLAFFRREYEYDYEKTSSIIENKKFKTFDAPKLIITPAVVLSGVFIVLLVGFFGYLFYQYRTYSGAPKLDIYSPKNSQIITSENLDITGKTEMESVLFINNQKVNLNTDGSFATTIKLKEGLNTISFLSVNKLGKESEDARTVIFRSAKEVKEASESSKITY